jgi:oxygen-dependent protoporphyrinogen oxidase
MLARSENKDGEMAVDVVVVGAGLSGLVTAFRLHRAGLAVQVLEAASRPGGVIGSERRDGVLMERGPNSGMDVGSDIGGLLGELGIADARVNARAAAARRYIVHGGRLQALPGSAGEFIRTRVFSTRAKFLLLGEPFVKRAPADRDESIADFVRRRLGAEVLDYAVEPFVSGIYAGDPHALSLAAAFPRLHELEQRHGSLVRGAIAGRGDRRSSGERSKAKATSFSFRGGMQTLTDALAAALPAVACGARVSRIDQEADGRFSVEATTLATLRASAVVLATPAHAAAPLVQDLAPQAAAALASIPYAPVAIVVSAYRRADVGHPLDGFGVLAPAVEHPEILGTLFSSTMFEGRCDPDSVVLTTFVGGRRHPEHVSASDTELLDRVQRELGKLLEVKGPPRFSAITRWPQAIPQYTFGHLQRIAVLEAAERELPGLHFCANYRGGVSISDCIKNGAATAVAVVRCLADRARR